MSNPIKKFRRLTGLNAPKVAEAKPIPKGVLSLKRRLYSPSYRVKGKSIEPTERREYQSSSGMFKVEERPHSALRKRK